MYGFTIYYQVEAKRDGAFFNIANIMVGVTTDYYRNNSPLYEALGSVLGETLSPL